MQEEGQAQGLMVSLRPPRGFMEQNHTELDLLSENSANSVAINTFQWQAWDLVLILFICVESWLVLQPETCCLVWSSRTWTSHPSRTPSVTSLLFFSASVQQSLVVLLVSPAENPVP